MIFYKGRDITILMNKIIVLIGVLVCASTTPLQCHAKEMIRIGIADTGLDKHPGFPLPLCKSGHKDFTDPKVAIVNRIGEDHQGHGTHIAGLIHQYASQLYLNGVDQDTQIKNLKQLIGGVKTDYCFVIYKWTDGSGNPDYGYGRFLNAILEEKIDFLNLSLNGRTFDQREVAIMKALVAKGVVVVAAAGNNGLTLKEHERFSFPSSIDGVIAVGNLKDKFLGPIVLPPGQELEKKVMNPESDRGPVVRIWMQGTGQVSLSLGGSVETRTGTSAAAANYTGYLVNKAITKGSK